MKKIMCIILTLVICISATSCDLSIGSPGGRIAPPNNNFTPVDGKWVIDSYRTVDASSFSNADAKEWIGKEVQFNGEAAYFNGDYCVNPQYKVKTIDLENYLKHEYAIEISPFDIKSTNVQIVTITSSNRFFNEFIKLNNSTAAVYVDGVFFIMNKIDNKTDENLLDIALKNAEEQSSDSNEKTSGILLGFRLNSGKQVSTKDKNNQQIYRTIWIASHGKTIGTVLETPDLFVPRKSGFWRVGVVRDYYKENYRDNIFAYPIDKEYKQPYMYESNEFKGAINSSRSIIYINNDYVSTELNENGTIKGTSEKWQRNVYEVLPVDDINGGRAMKISDFTGDTGIKILNDEAALYYSSLLEEEKRGLQSVPNSDNFSIVRRNGHCVLKGRLNYFPQKENRSFRDFNLRMIPPHRLVQFDELYVPWNEIKSKVPEAVDAFTSPNKDIAVILTKKMIFVYGITKGRLGENPLKKIKIKDDETIVMAEWAMGSYVDRWEKSLIKSKAVSVDK